MLKFNDKTNAFVLFTDDVDRAEASGMSLSRDIRGPDGERVYFTSDYNNQPDYNPYAAVEFYGEADEKAKAKLVPFVESYRASWAEDYDIDVPVPMGRELLPYQRAGISYCRSRTNSVIADEPGLGKTIQAIGLANLKEAQRILVLCPASIRNNWRREIFDWSTIRQVTVGTIRSGKDDLGMWDNYTICSYDLARNHRIHDLLCSVEWDLVIADEGHYLKSSTAQRTRSLFGGGDPGTQFYQNGIDRHTKGIVALTGTPLPNRPREAYMLARGLDWMSIDLLSSDAFLYRFNPSVKMSTGYNLEEKGRLGELNARLRCNFMVRRRKKDVLKQLPDKRYEMTYIDPDGAINRVLAQEALIDFDPSDIFNGSFDMDGTPISTLRKEMGEAMVPRIADYMTYLFDIVEQEKVLLFAHHTSVIFALAEQLARYLPVIHKGGMSDDAKGNSLYEFIEGRSRLMIAQLDTMEGVDGLQTVCDNVVFGEPAWTPGRNEQCVDRAHRMGQHGNVVAHFLLVEGSFNEKVLNAVLDKSEDLHYTLDRKLV
jgi:SNF2 family DNA or RNA helicase